MGVLGRWRGLADDPGPEVGVLAFEQAQEHPAIVGTGGFVMAGQITAEQHIEFLHAAAAQEAESVEIAHGGKGVERECVDYRLMAADVGRPSRRRKQRSTQTSTCRVRFANQ